MPIELTPEQLQRVRYLVEERYHDRDELQAALDAMSAEELHAYVNGFNWDVGAEPLVRVLSHPRCDRGTALMIYWRADPIFDLKYDSREQLAAATRPERVEIYDMCRDIERRLAAAGSFATARMAYDPRSDHGRDLTRQRRKRRPRPIYEWRGSKLVRVGVESLPDEPEIDVRGALPAVVFEPVVGESADTQAAGKRRSRKN